MKMNKRGMLDDLFDLLFTVIISFFLLFFVNAALLSTVEQSQSVSLKEAATMNQALSAITNLRVQVHQGAAINPSEIESKIASSKVLGGRVITGCEDYYASEDCNNDVVGLYTKSADSCQWSDAQKSCQFIPEVMPT